MGARARPGLKTLDDALEIRRQVLLAFEAAERETDPDAQRRLLTFVIVGGGPTGVELAGALAEIARQSLRQDFRNIRPNRRASCCSRAGRTFWEPSRSRCSGPRANRSSDSASTCAPNRSSPTSMRTASSGVRRQPSHPRVAGERIVAQTVLWAAGVAASPLARSLGVPLDRAGRVPAEPTLAVPGHPEVFVVGDICALQQDGQPLPGVAQVAKQEGAHAARNVLRAIRGEPLEPFRYRDYGNMATIGRGSAVADIGGFKASGFLAWLIWIFIHIFWLIGFRNRIAVMSEWAWAYLTFQRRVRLITGDKLWQSSDPPRPA